MWTPPNESEFVYRAKIACVCDEAVFTNSGPLRILIISRSGGMAGSTESIIYLARGLAQRGHEVHLGCPAKVVFWERLKDDPVKLHEIPFSGKGDVRSVYMLYHLVRRERIQLVNAQSGADRYVGMMARMIPGFGARLVHTRRQRINSSGGALQRWLYMKGTDGLVAVSEGVKRSMLKKGYPENQVKVIPNGTPREKYHAWDPKRTDWLSRQLGICVDDFVIGCVARPKRQDHLFRALTLLPFKPRVLFLGLSYTEAEKNFPESFRLAREHDCQMHLLGRQSPRDVLAWLKLMKFNVLPSVIEGLSQSLLEAMAMGVPCIATEAAGNPDLIRHGENGLLYENHNPTDLAKKMLELYSSAEKRRQMAEAGKKTALEDFSIDQTIEGYQRYFYGLLGIEANGRLS